MDIIKFVDVVKSYDQNLEPVINGINFSIKKGEFITLIGPSGCGKTTLLKLINGLIEADSGSLYIQDKEIKEWDIIELRRSIGYVIQQVGLFPHLTIEENIGYVLNIKKIPKTNRRKRTRELIKLVSLDERYLSKYPRELSGGQKQRIGVARALAADPDIILMDEPLGAVDEVARRTLQDELLDIYNHVKKTIIFVTHDIEEAIKLGSRIVLLHKGTIQQAGTKEEMLLHPANEFVKKFLGIKNFSAYLNVASIGELCETVNRDEEIKYMKSSVPLLGVKSSIMEGIKIMFDHGVENIGIKGEDGHVVGQFTLSSAFKKFEK